MFNCFSKLAVTLFKQLGLHCKILSSLKTWKISPTVAEKANLSKMTCSKKSFQKFPILLYKPCVLYIYLLILILKNSIYCQKKGIKGKKI